MNDEVKEKIKQLASDGELPSLRDGDVTFWDRDRLLFCLVFDNIDIFTKGLQLIVERKADEISKFNVEVANSDSSSDSDNDDIGDVETFETWRDVSLIKVAVLRELDAAVLLLGALNSECNYSAIRLVYEFGRWKCLQNLLQKRKSMDWKPVKLCKFISFLMRAQTFDKDFREEENGNVDFGKCVDLLFEYAQYEINEQNDDHYSALHLAVMYNKTETIFELLKKGAYIGVIDRNNRPAIWNITPQTLERYFDQCIIGDDLIVFNFENLICPSDEYPNDMAGIEFISNSSDLKYLLEHPLIESFLFLKWNRLLAIFLLDFVIYSVLVISLGYSSFCYISNPSRHDIQMIVLTVLFIAYVGSRRALQMVFCSSKHRRSLESYSNILLSVLIIVFLVIFLFAVPFQLHKTTFAAVCIILITYEFFMLAGTFWHFSIYAEMFIAVAKSSVKSLQLYAIFLPAFSLLFYILLGEGNWGNTDENDLNNFSTLGSSIVKVIIMSAGEFDVANVDFGQNYISIYVLVGYVFLISTVFMNLLNGLAVSDTHQIKSKARITSFWRRCKVLARYEEVLSNKHHWFR